MPDLWLLSALDSLLESLVSPEDALAGALGIDTSARAATFGDVWTSFTSSPIEARPPRGVTAAIAKAAGVSQREVQRWRQSFLGGPAQKRRLPTFRLGKLSDAARDRMIRDRLRRLPPSSVSFRGQYHISASERRHPFTIALDQDQLDRIADEERPVDAFYSAIFDEYGGLGGLTTIDDVESLDIE